jgi:hypothetical protein
MEKIIFLFSTPEGGGQEVKTFLEQSHGFKFNSNCNRELWRVYDICQETRNKSLGGSGEGILKNFVFDSQDFSDNWGVRDDTMGKNFGYGFKMWVFLKINMPSAKFIFTHLPFEKNVARMAAMNKSWIPRYGSCLSNCEARMAGQISQFEQFSAFYDKSCLLLQSFDKDKINNFIK